MQGLDGGLDGDCGAKTGCVGAYCCVEGFDAGIESGEGVEDFLGAGGGFTGEDGGGPVGVPGWFGDLEVVYDVSLFWDGGYSGWFWGGDAFEPEPHWAI